MSQGDIQAAIRAVTGTAGSYEGDWHALFTSAGIATGDFDGRLLAWINQQLGYTYTNLNDAMAAFAAANGATTFSAMTGVSLPTLAAGAKVAILGDSLFARGNAATTAGAFTTIQNKANQELMWARALNPKFISTVWWDNTATAAHDIPTYGDASAQDNLYRGYNFGYSGDTTTGIAKRTAQVISSGAQVCYVSAGTNTDSTNTAVFKEAQLDAVTTTLTNAGIKVILGTIRPRYSGDRETLNNVLSTTSGSGVVTLVRNAHGLTNTSASTKEMEFVSPGVTVGGITLNGRILSGTGGYTVNVVDANTITITQGTLANANVTNGGGSFTWHRNGFTDFAGVFNVGLCIMPSDPRHAVHDAVNVWIRAQAGRAAGAVTVVDLDTVLKDPTYSATTGVTEPYNWVTLDGVHDSAAGAAAVGPLLSAAINKFVLAGTAFSTDPTVSNILVPSGALTGSGGAAPAGFSGNLPTGWQFDGGLITNTTGTCSVTANPDTSGNYLEVNGTVDGLGGAGTFSVMRFTPTTKTTTGYLTTDYVQAIYELEIVSQTAGIIPAFQVTLGTGSTITARGLGQTRADYNTEPYPSIANRYWILSEPYLAGVAASLNPRLDMSIRKDVAGTFTYRVRRVMLRVVPNPAAQFPWVP